jgi:glutamyl-tRNA synthetase
MMSSQLVLAAGANPATLLPVVLIASSVNEARPSPVIAIRYDNVPALAGGATVEFTGASGTPVYGVDNAIKELRETFPYLKGKNVPLVRRIVSHTCLHW